MDAGKIDNGDFILYVIFCQIILNQMSLGTILVSENKLRFWNEIPTLFLVSIIFLATLKTQIFML